MSFHWMGRLLTTKITTEITTTITANIMKFPAGFAGKNMRRMPII